jgi:3-hydroxyacyl-CoA dehydrogenase
VAAGETYMGLVETGVGLIPAGGGVKELVRRLVSPAMRAAPNTPPLPFVQKAFETIAMAKTSGSALEAREMGFLAQSDRVVMNPDHLLSAARREVLDLADGYAPPQRGYNVYAAGRTVRVALDLAVRSMQWGRYATEYDGVIAGHLARAITGGALSLPQWVDEGYMLKLEKEAFLELLENEKTHERIRAMLESGKPLRN